MSRRGAPAAAAATGLLLLAQQESLFEEFNGAVGIAVARAATKGIPQTTAPQQPVRLISLSIGLIPSPSVAFAPSPCD